MTVSNTELRYSPAIILGLVAALVLSLALWSMDRAGDGAVQASAVKASASEQTVYRWKMVTTWPKNFPGLGMGPENFARMVEEMSEGQLQVRVYGGGEIVPALGAFDAVSEGVAELGHGAAYYWKEIGRAHV